VRWQKVTIDQLSYCTNLTLVLAVAALGYALTFAKDADFISGKERCSLAVLLLIGLLGLSVSVLCGLLCTLNRLHDFRETAQRAKDSPDAVSKEESDQMGKVTWRLFYAQTWAFLVAIALVAIVVAFVRIPKLFSN
jgi:hypothetical protein